MIHALKPKLHHFAWGSTTSIPSMLGIEPTDQPVAEAWFGEVAEIVTPGGGTTTLGEMISEDRIGTLGHPNLSDPRHELPYLVKLLAARWPLSIQVHPSSDAAEVGFERENALGIPVNHPTRLYRDRNAKPEAILALEHFEMLAGFRDPIETASLIGTLSVPSLKPTAELLRAGGAEALRNAVTDLCALEVDAVAIAVEEIAAACGGSVPPEYASLCQWIGDLTKKFPNDVGVVIALLMNHIVLERFDLAFVDVGVVHSYLGGLGLEIMGNSDNVVRGGLTIKHVDVFELLRQLNFEPGFPFIVRSSERQDSAAEFTVPTDRFNLSVLEVGVDGTVFEVDGPEIVVVLEGGATVTELVGDSPPGVGLGLGLGEAAFIGAVTRRYRIDGPGRLGRVTPGSAA